MSKCSQHQTKRFLEAIYSKTMDTIKNKGQEAIRVYQITKILTIPVNINSSSNHTSRITTINNKEINNLNIIIPKVNIISSPMLQIIQLMFHNLDLALDQLQMIEQIY